MTREELTARLTGPFHGGLADAAAAEVLAADAAELLYDLVTGDCGAMAAPERHKLRFRGAWVLERIFFAAPERFAPCEERFCRRDFAACTDPGARRSFAKMMDCLLARRLSPLLAPPERIAAADCAATPPAARNIAAGWAADPPTVECIDADSAAVRPPAPATVPHAAAGWAADSATLERIAAAAADWAADPATKAAVRIWCVEVLRQCRGWVGWVDAVWDDLLETLSRDTTPAIARRMKGWIAE